MVPLNVAQTGQMTLPGILIFKVINTDYDKYAVFHVCDISKPDEPYDKIVTALRSPSEIYVDPISFGLMAWDLIDKIGINPMLIPLAGRSQCLSLN
jgi:hypothetical protein